MALQDKIIIKKYKNEEIIEIELNLNNYVNGNTVFSFKEFEKVSISFISIKDHFLEIDAPYKDSFIIIKNGQSKIINNFDYKRNNNTYIPEKYTFKVIEQQRIINYYYFEVTSNALGQAVFDIRQVVNDFSKGLQYDLFSRSFTNIKTESINDEISICMFLIENVDELKVNIEQILKHPIEQLSKSYRYSNRPSKSDYYQIKSSLRHGYNEFDTRKVLTKKTVLTNNNQENGILKSLLIKINYSIIKTIRYLNEHELVLQAKINELDDKKITSYQQLIMINGYHDKKYKEKINTDYAIFNQEIKKTKENIKNLKYMISQLNDTYSHIQETLSTTFLKDIKANMISNLMHLTKNPYYRYINEFNNKLSNINKAYTTTTSLSYKKTSQLYEIYVLILLFHIFKQCGYDSKQLIRDNLYQLFENKHFIFNKDNLTINVDYDQIVPRIENALYNEIVNQNCSHNKPDILVKVFQDHQLLHAFIIEVKCRNKNNIYDKYGETKVFSQLKDYTNFWYLDQFGHIKKGVIDRVYAIYPSSLYEINKLNYNQIYLMSINPTSQFNDDESFILLKQEIKRYI